MIERLLLNRRENDEYSTTLVIQIDAESEAAARYIATTKDRLGFRTNTGKSDRHFCLSLNYLLYTGLFFNPETIRIPTNPSALIVQACIHCVVSHLFGGYLRSI
jgi:hypothetical protein